MEKRIATLFRFQGKGRRSLRCATYRLNDALELRLEYEQPNGDEWVRAERFDLLDTNAVARRAHEWQLALKAEGFLELPVDRDREA